MGKTDQNFTAEGCTRREASSSYEPDYLIAQSRVNDVCDVEEDDGQCVVEVGVTQHLNYYFFGKHHNIMLLRSLCGSWGFDVNLFGHRGFYCHLFARTVPVSAGFSGGSPFTGDPSDPDQC